MPCRAVLLAALGATFSQHIQASPDGNFETQCGSEDDHGWPRFQSLVELQSSAWALYFQEVYGGLPTKYPVCIFDLWALDQEAYHKANISGHTPVPATANLTDGDLFQGAWSLTGYQIYHATWKPLPANTWVEVTHTVYPSELKGFWVWRNRGSGIWYNTGRTIVFPTPADPAQLHKAAIEFLTANCSVKVSSAWPQLESDIFGLCAREKGYDSIQFEPKQGEKPVGTFGMPGLTEMVLVNMDGHNSCGVADSSATPLRAGWLASEKCTCENVHIADGCGLMPRAPFPINIIGSTPRLCKNQEGAFWNRWKACDPTSCKMTSCDFQQRVAQKMTSAPLDEPERALIV